MRITYHVDEKVDESCLQTSVSLQIAAKMKQTAFLKIRFVFSLRSIW